MTGTINKVWAFKRQTARGTAATGAGATRFFTSDSAVLDLVRDAVDFNEKAENQQTNDSTHANERVEGSTPLIARTTSSALWWEDLLKRAATTPGASSASAGDGFTLVGATGILSRAAGAGESFVTDGVRVGQIRRLTGMTEASVNDRNVLVTVVTPTTLTLVPIDRGAALVDSAESTAASLAFPGRETFIPGSGHTDNYYTFEEFYSDVDLALQSVDVKVNNLGLSWTVGQAIRETWNWIGLSQTKTEGAGSSFTDPTQAAASRALRPHRGFAFLADGSLCDLVSVELTVDHGRSVQGRLFCGIDGNEVTDGQRINVSGRMQLYFRDGALYDRFKNETEFMCSFTNFRNDAAEPEPFRSVFLPRVKLNSFRRDDGDRITATADFVCHARDAADVGFHPTSIAYQDSALT